jgi:hypothetical protein
MKRRHHTPGQIVRRLSEADRMRGEGSPVVDVGKYLMVTGQAYYRWRNWGVSRFLDMLSLSERVGSCPKTDGSFHCSSRPRLCSL